MDYISESTQSDRKKFGQFFTPPQVASFMVEWVTSIESIEKMRLLDPATGLGIFQKVAADVVKGVVNFDCYEIDEKIIQYAKKEIPNVEGLNINIINEDFLGTEISLYNGIICNPPYMKFQDYNNLAAIEKLEKQLGLHLSGYSNIYVLFLLRCLHQLHENGRMAFIIPSDFLGTGYGVKIKEVLLKSGMLRHIIFFDDRKSIFSDATVTSCIILLENNAESDRVRFLKLPLDWENVLTIDQVFDEEIHNVEVYRKTYSSEQLDPHIKWTSLLKKDIISLDSNGLTSIKTYGVFKRGIATGENKFFMLSSSQVEKHSLGNSSALRHCISKSEDVRSDFFTASDFEKLILDNKKVFLLDTVGLNEGEFNEPLRAYLELAKPMGVMERYLVKARRVWSKQEQKGAATIWASVFNRNRVKFIRNRAEVLNLTCFHGFYPHKQVSEDDIEILHAYLLTDICRVVFNQNDRSYGGGLKKFEPGDLNNSSVVDIGKIDRNSKVEIKKLYSLIEGQANNLEEHQKRLEHIFENLLLLSDDSPPPDTH